MADALRLAAGRRFAVSPRIYAPKCSARDHWSASASSRGDARLGRGVLEQQVELLIEAHRAHNRLEAVKFLLTTRRDLESESRASTPLPSASRVTSATTRSSRCLTGRLTDAHNYLVTSAAVQGRRT
jgi:hypothetical protein